MANPSPCSKAVPDLTPTTDIDALSFNAGTNLDFVVNLFEINTVVTTGAISFKIAKLGIFSITYSTVSGNSNVFGGTANQNSNWTFTEDANYIYVSSKPGVTIAAGGQAVIGFNIARTGGTIYTTQNLSATITTGSGGETDASDNSIVTGVSAN